MTQDFILGIVGALAVVLTLMCVSRLITNARIRLQLLDQREAEKEARVGAIGRQDDHTGGSGRDDSSALTASGSTLKRCVEGGPLHHYEARYSRSRVPVVFRNLNLRQTKALDLARLIEAQTTTVDAYCGDVCTWCGKIVNPQHQVAVARGPDGEDVIEVSVEGTVR